MALHLANLRRKIDRDAVPRGSSSPSRESITLRAAGL